MLMNFSVKKIVLTVTVLAIVLSPVIFAFLIFEETPAVSSQKLVEVEDASRAKKTIKKILSSLRRPSASASISTTENDLNAIMAFASRGVKKFSGHAEITSRGLYFASSLRTPHNPFGNFLNVQFGLEPSLSGLKILEVSVGKIELPGGLALSLLRFALNMALDDEGGTKGLKAVKSVSFEGREMTINLEPVPDFRPQFVRYKNLLKSYRDEAVLLGDPKVVRIYYMSLVKQAEALPKNRSRSLAKFMGPLFKMAKDRSDIKLTDRADENQAALLALAMFFGSHHFESLIGPVRTEEMSLKRFKKPKATLARRRDLMLHFIISAGLKVVSDEGIAYSIGEFKELLDAAGKRGSGFSFADLAADRAGTHFARIVTNRQGGAIRLQRFLEGGMSENQFFPKISDLPEGLSKADFEQRYVNVEAAQYVDMVNEIDNRIARLPLYSEGRVLSSSP